MKTLKTLALLALCSCTGLVGCTQHPTNTPGGPQALTAAPGGGTVDPASLSFKTALLDTFFHDLAARQGFNGTVLVAQNGHILYKGAYGYRSMSEKDTLTTQTPFQLASVSKQFTAVAIMQLREHGLLNYDDFVWQHIPNFPYDSSLTLRMLLTHRSGLPNYQHALDHYWDRSRPMTNKDMVAKLIELRPRPFGPPNLRFHYNNTNYVLLAYIVEQISGKSFSQYAQERLFAPLGMNHTFVFDGTNTYRLDSAAVGNNWDRRPLPLDYLDSVTGDKSLYSTVEDLYKWDRGLYTDKIIRQETLQEAFLPASDEPNLLTRNYGFGWRLLRMPDHQWLTFHTGWWHGFKNYFMRNLSDQTTVILLSNVANGYLSQVKMVQAILYPEKARYFLRGESIDPENGDMPLVGETETLEGGGNASDLTLSQLYSLVPRPVVRKKTVLSTRTALRKKPARRPLRQR